MPRLVAVFDKFRGTATAQELVAVAIAEATALGWEASGLPLADGGEGSLDVLGGANKTTLVTGPDGDPVRASWRLDGKTAFIEMAAASGLVLAGGAEENDPLSADTLGTGELISTAVELGARTVYVFLGGSATTDGGFGAIRGMPPRARMKEVELIVACDVQTRFVDAASVFGPQKGASRAQVKMLTRRLERLQQIYHEEYGVDVSEVAGAGAAGGLAGGLLAMGGRIESGFDVLAEWMGLDELLEGADLVVTGEGKLDATSFQGKLVGGVASWAKAEGTPVLAVVGIERGAEVPSHVEVVSLSERFGEEASMATPVALTADVVRERLATWPTD